MPAVDDRRPTLPAKRRNVGRATALEIVVVLPPLSRSGGKATRTSGVVRVLSDEVSRGQGRRCRCPPVRTKVSRFRGERVGRRTVALRLSPTLAPPLPVKKTDVRVARLRNGKLGIGEEKLLSRLEAELPKVSPDVRHYFFSREGFDDGLISLAEADPQRVKLVTPADLY